VLAAARRLGKRHELGAIVIALSNREAHPLLARLRIEQPGDRRQCELIRVADPVASQIPVFGEELRKIEVVDRGVERRYLILALYTECRRSRHAARASA
jgi:hypothetical protein